MSGTDIDTRSGAPQQTSTMPVTTQNKGTTGVELAMQVGALIADLASGKGLSPTIKPDGTVDAKAVEANAAIQKAQSETLRTDLAELQTEIKQAFLVIASPELHQADDVLAAKALIAAVTASGVAKVPGAPPPAHEYNAFLSGIVSMALLEAMMEMMKSDEVGEKLASVLWLGTKAAVEDLTDAMVKNIKDKAKAEAVEHIIQAACSLGAMCCSLGGAGMGMRKGVSAAQSQAMQMLGQAGEKFFTGFLQNAALAPLTIVKGNLDAQKAILDMMKEFLTTMMQKEEQMGNDYQKNFDSFNDSLKQWIETLSRIGNKLTDK